MRRSQAAPLIGAVVAAAVVVTVALAHGNGGSTPASRSLRSLVTAAGPISINRGGATFNPEPSKSGAATLSAKQVYADFNNGKAIPPETLTGYGALSVPLGPGTPGRYLYRDRPVWAFVRSGGCPISDQAPDVSPPPPPATPLTCTAWTFLDPTTGHDVLSTFSDPQ